MQRELHIKYNYIWISTYRWTCIWALYIHVAYVLSHATECHVQFVLCNYTNLQLHVSHATEFQLQTTVAKPKIFSCDTYCLYRVCYLISCWSYVVHPRFTPLYSHEFVSKPAWMDLGSWWDTPIVTRPNQSCQSY